MTPSADTFLEVSPSVDANMRILDVPFVIAVWLNVSADEHALCQDDLSQCAFKHGLPLAFHEKDCLHSVSVRSAFGHRFSRDEHELEGAPERSVAGGFLKGCVAASTVVIETCNAVAYNTAQFEDHSQTAPFFWREGAACQEDCVGGRARQHLVH